jgi:hypothetical protein
MASSTSHIHRSIVLVFCAALIVAGAGFAVARTSSGPPWAQELECDTTSEATGDTGSIGVAEECETEEEVAEIDVAVVRAEVEEYFAAVEGDCGLEVLGEYDLGEEATLEAFDALVTGLESGQTSHMVNSVRVLLENCADHPNDGLRNALYHHGLNWVRHYEHEQRMREKFADKWPDGKPGNGGGSHGNPHETETAGKPDKDRVKDHGNGSSNGNGNGNANGHSK